MDLKEIIENHNIPDKTDFHATTSYKFKEDLFYFLQSIGSEDLICTEFGTSRGFRDYSQVYYNINKHL